MIRKILLASFVAVGMSSCTVAMIAAAPGVTSALASPPAASVAR